MRDVEELWRRSGVKRGAMSEEKRRSQAAMQPRVSNECSLDSASTAGEGCVLLLLSLADSIETVSAWTEMLRWCMSAMDGRVLRL